MAINQDYFDNMCRLCAKIVFSLSSIYEDDYDGISSLEKLKTIFGIEITEDDNFPKYICKSCRRQLKTSFEFKNMCLLSEQLLSKYEEEMKSKETDNNNEVDIETRYYIEVDESVINEFDSDLQLTDIEQYFSEQVVRENDEIVTDNFEQNFVKHSEKKLRTSYKLKKRNISYKKGNYNTDKHHKCKVCKKLFGSELRVKLHMQRIHRQIYLEECKVVCPKCGMKFQHTRNLKRHLVYHNVDSYFGCDFCDVKLYSKKSWRTHIKIHDGEINVICKICNKTITTKTSHVFHMSHHRTKESITNQTYYSCFTCQINFKSFQDLEKHSLQNHCLNIPDEHDYLEGLNTKSNLTSTDNQPVMNEQFREIEKNVEKIFNEEIEKENWTELNNVKPNTIQNGDEDSTKCKSLNINASVTFQCNLCGRLYKNLADLNFHVNECYEKVNRPKSFMCDICGKCFPSAWTLTNHKAGHSNARPYICDICGQRFKWHNDLTNHKSRIHEKLRPYVCKLCGKRCGTSATLKSHMRFHTGERPYICAVCNVSFAQNSSLKEHMFKHTGGQECTCPICNKVFKTPLRLRTHIKRHNTQRKLYPCDLCGRMFTEKSSVRKHKFKIHNEMY